MVEAARLKAGKADSQDTRQRLVLCALALSTCAPPHPLQLLPEGAARFTRSILSEDLE